MKSLLRSSLALLALASILLPAASWAAPRE
jgi:hypothetical protein